MPLGGIDTGCIDMNGDGMWGYCTIFNSHVPRRGPINVPALGLSLGGTTWILTTTPLHRIDEPTDYGSSATRPTNQADRIWYWGHYPVTDIQYETSAPVRVALRAWAPFVPGDIFSSTLPAALFEIHLYNDSGVPQVGRLVFNFPGPDAMETGGTPVIRREFHANEVSSLSGVEISSPNANYVVSIQEDQDVWIGDSLGVDTGAWGRIDKGLPTGSNGVGTSISVPFDLNPGEKTSKRFFLTWNSPRWFATGHPDPANLSWLPWYPDSKVPQSNRQSYRHMYSKIHSNAWDVAQYMAIHHSQLLQRIFAWQEVIYSDHALPGWLQDSLINILHLITETGFWADATEPLGAWCQPEQGLFALNEDPRHCPQMECVPCSFYGNYPLIYFFPQLARSTLQGYKAYQFANGEVAWIFGGCTDTPPTPPLEMAAPTRGYQTTLNGPCVVDMVYRLWRRTNDSSILDEFYDLVKRSTIFTMNLRPESGPDGIISFPSGNAGLEWFEACTWAGMAVHVGGIHLANLLMAKQMAQTVGDRPFADQCQTWFVQGHNAMEQKLWTDGGYYLNYWEPETDRRSDLIMANQLDGEWMAQMAGLDHVFSPERTLKVLRVIETTCVAATAYGAVNFTSPEGMPTANGEARPGWSMHPSAFFPPETLLLGMTYMYFGHKDLGLEICYRCWSQIARLGRVWDQPNLIRGDTGEVIYGGDYYQNMLLWALPAALTQQDLSGPSKPTGLVDQILRSSATITPHAVP